MMSEQINAQVKINSDAIKLWQSDERQNRQLKKVLVEIVEFIHWDRPRGLHIYPTELRDRAIKTLQESGCEVKDHKECERLTKIKRSL